MSFSHILWTFRPTGDPPDSGPLWKELGPAQLGPGQFSWAPWQALAQEALCHVVESLWELVFTGMLTSCFADWACPVHGLILPRTLGWLHS